MQRVPRRQFVKGLFLGTISSTFLSKPWSTAYAAEYSTVPRPTGQITLNIQDYPPLQEAFGSIRIGVNPIEPGEGSPQGQFYPIIINRGANDDFYVLDSRCRHFFCVVRPYAASEPGMRCACHGSLYDLNGDVLEGPAREALDSYEFTHEGDVITIRVPDLTYSVTIARVQNPADRVRLSFTAYPFVEYEVQFRERITGPWSIIPFSQTTEGPFNETVFVHADQTRTVGLYGERAAATGFYAVAMRIKDVTAIL